MYINMRNRGLFSGLCRGRGERSRETRDCVLGCGPLNATNASKHLTDQSKEKNFLLIDQSESASKHL